MSTDKDKQLEETTNLSPTETTPENSEQPRIPTKRYQDLVNRLGTEEQKASLEQALEFHRQAGNIDQINPELHRKTLEYYERLHAHQPKEDERASDLKAAAHFIKRKVSHQREETPEGITLDIARAVFWRAYRAIVNEETGIDLKSDTVRNDPNLAEAMNNMVHWLTGSTEGAWDPKKSLVIYGALGVGKSTLAQAAHITSAFFKTRYAWQEQYLGFISMDRLFFDISTTEDIKDFNQLARGNWVIDEVKTEHTKYKHYGNDLPLLNLVIGARHDLWKQEGKQTILTTNIPPSEIAALITNTAEERERMRSRMGQQYTTYQLKGDNKRHPKHRIR